MCGEGAVEDVVSQRTTSGSGQRAPAGEQASCSIHALAIDGVTSLTYFETTGPRGLRSTTDDWAYPAGHLD